MKELVVITATWCQPCKAYKETVLEEAHSKAQIEGRGYTVTILDADKNQDFCQSHGVRSVPTTFVMVDGKVEATMIGKQSLEQIVKELK